MRGLSGGGSAVEVIGGADAEEVVVGGEFH